MEYPKFRRDAVLLALSAAAGFLLLRYLGPVLLPFGVGMLAALAAEPVVRWMQRRLHLPRWLCAGLSVAGLYGMLILLLALLCRLLWQELSAFVRGLPAMLSELSVLAGGWKARFLALGEHLPDGLQAVFTRSVTEVLENGAGLAEKVYTWLFTATAAVVGALPDLLLFLLTAVLSSFMLAARLPELRKLWQRKVPAHWRQRCDRVLVHLRATLGGWLRAQVKLMAICALVLTAGFLILRIDYPLLFGLVIALIDALPALGTGLILIPWALVMYLRGNQFLGTGLLLLYGTAALLRTALEPRMLGKQMGLDPLWTLLALYSGYRLLGIGGMILFPIAAIMVRQLLRHDPGGDTHRH